MKNEAAFQRKAKNLQYIRASNRAEIFRCLALTANVTRMELAARLGLSKMAISNIVNELIEADLVCESENTQVQAYGRRSAMLQLRSEKFLAIGIYLSRDHIQAILADITGRTLDVVQESLQLAQTAKQNRKALITKLDRLYQTIGHRWLVDKPYGHVSGIGLCSIGPLDLQSGTLLDPPNFYGVEMVGLKEQLLRHFQLPVWIENDMNAAALGEFLYGAAKEHQHALYLGLDNGIGAGILSYGRIFEGSSGYGGEVGHMSIDMNGPACSCGQNGCLETYLSLPVLIRQSGASSLDELLASRSDRDRRQTWEPGYIRALTSGLVNLVNIFDPEIVLLGHAGAILATDYLHQLETYVNQHSFQRRARDIRIVLASFGEMAPLTGAASLVFQAVFRGDLDPAMPVPPI